MSPRSLHSDSFRDISHAQSGAQSTRRSKKVVPSLYVGSSGTHMRQVEAHEDAYWRAQFFRENYYVRGRGYDQYQPAYAMACVEALKNPSAAFPEMESLLEAKWQMHSGSSLLPWREVRGAMQAAWEHASVQTFRVNALSTSSLAFSDISSAIQPLCRSCTALADDLQRLGVVPMSDFARQVLQRHVQMLRSFSVALQKAVARNLSSPSDSPWAYWSYRLHSQWMKFKNRMSEWEPTQVFELCELRERTLLRAYQRTLRKALPVELMALLNQQLQQLQIHAEKLSWVRQNYKNL